MLKSSIGNENREKKESALKRNSHTAKDPNRILSFCFQSLCVHHPTSIKLKSKSFSVLSASDGEHISFVSVIFLRAQYASNKTRDETNKNNTGKITSSFFSHFYPLSARCRRAPVADADCVAIIRRRCSCWWCFRGYYSHYYTYTVLCMNFVCNIVVVAVAVLRLGLVQIFGRVFFSFVFFFVRWLFSFDFICFQFFIATRTAGTYNLSGEGAMCKRRVQQSTWIMPRSHLCARANLNVVGPSFCFSLASYLASMPWTGNNADNDIVRANEKILWID